MVSSRPLGVEELAEVFAINFDEEMSGIPKFEPSWRDPSAEMAVLSACSALVTIVDGMCGSIVQFSHFSVKEYLTSDRIANAEHLSHFHIHPKPAHTLIAKSCLSVLFRLDYNMDKAKIKNFPLAEYAARYWVDHARFEDVSLYIQDGMDLLFDKDKPHFSTWVWVYDMDEYGEEDFFMWCPDPLYYAALCGFRGLVERLLTAHPQDLNAKVGDWGPPLNAALAKGHLDIALFLLDRGADGQNGGKMYQTGLYIASSSGYAGVVRSLIDRGADLNAICEDHDDGYYVVKRTPLHIATYKGRRDIAMLLLECGADTEILSSFNQTALYMASSRGCADVVRSLIDCGADLNAICKNYPDGDDVKWTPLHVAIAEERRDIVVLLLECGADTEARSSWDQTALHVASSRRCADIVQQLISYGADLNAECKRIDWYDPYENDVKWTPLHVAIRDGTPPIARTLLEHGANPSAPDNLGTTALHLASRRGWREVRFVELLLEYGANVDARDKKGWTPLHEAAYHLNLGVVVVLLNRGADPHAQTNEGRTPIQLANAALPWLSKEGQAQIIRLLSERTGERV